VDVGSLRAENGDEVAALGVARQARDVERAVDRRPIVDVVGARDDHGPDLRPGKSGDLGGDALDRPLGLEIRVEQVAGDEDDVDHLGQGEVDRGREGGELALALGYRGLPEVGVPGPKMDVRGVQQSEHPVRRPPMSRRQWRHRTGLNAIRSGRQ
jgi:hypothetical protein